MKLSVPYPQGSKTKTGLTISSDGNSQRQGIERERETLEEKFLKLSVLVQVRPGWNRYTSPSPVQHSVCHAVRVQSNRALIRVCWFSSDFLQVRMSNSVTFFFPNKDFQMISVPRSCPVVDLYIYIYIYIILYHTSHLQRLMVWCKQNGLFHFHLLVYFDKLPRTTETLRIRVSSTRSCTKGGHAKECKGLHSIDIRQSHRHPYSIIFHYKRGRPCFAFPRPCW